MLFRRPTYSVRSRLLRSVLRFDTTLWRPWSATRCATGVALPILAAILAGHPAWGVLGALGALYAGIVSYNGVFATRFRTMLAISVLMALLTFVGSSLSVYPSVAAIVVALTGFGLALASASSPMVNSVSVLAVCILVVLTGIPSTAADPRGNALTVLGGGLVQTFLLTVVWPIDPHYPERKAVSSAYETLARFVREMRGGVSGNIPPAEAFQDARTLLEEARRFRLREEHGWVLQALRAAEALRAGLVGFARSDAALRLQGAEAAVYADAVAAELERTFQAVSLSLRRHRFGTNEPLLTEGLRLPPVPTNLPQDEAWRTHREWIDLLRQELEDLCSPPPTGLTQVHADAPIAKSKSLGRRLWRSFVRLPESVVLESLAVQHAIRYGLALGIAVAASHAWSISHAYWLPLTVAIVLRADYATTISRGAQRLAGTIGGIIVASALAYLLHPLPVVLSALMVAASWLAYAVFQANYALYTGAITLYVVFSTAAGGLPEHQAGSERLTATIFGIVVSVAITLLWPVWQSGQVATVLRDASRAQADYGESVAAFLRGGHAEVLEDLRHRARSMRVQAESVVRAAEFEPRWGRGERLDSASEILECLEENAAIILTLHAQALQRHASRRPSNADAIDRVDRAIERARELGRFPNRSQGGGDG